jgi:hypothetical protein
MKLDIAPFKSCKFCHQMMPFPWGNSEIKILEDYKDKEYCSVGCWNKHQAIIAELNAPPRYCECGEEVARRDKKGKILTPHRRSKIQTCGNRDCVRKGIMKGRSAAKKPKVKKARVIKSFYAEPDIVERFYLALPQENMK